MYHMMRRKKNNVLGNAFQIVGGQGKSVKHDNQRRFVRAANKTRNKLKRRLPALYTHEPMQAKGKCFSS